MIGILQRYRIIFIVLGLVILGALIWLVAFRQNTVKIPSRGVFVMPYFKGW